MDVMVLDGGRTDAASQAGRHDIDVGALAAELRVALMRTGRRLRSEKAGNDLGDGQLSALGVLERRGPLTLRELADLERVQPPSMTRTVASLVRAGLVERTTHPYDRRAVLVALTAAGVSTVHETRRRRTAWLARRLAELSPAELADVARAGEILRRIADS